MPTAGLLGKQFGKFAQGERYCCDVAKWVPEQ